MSIYVNRSINMKKIKAIGFDMDYTLVRYHREAFERLTFKVVIDKLVKELNYPSFISQIEFDINKVIRGIVIDKKRGNLLKVSLHGKVKSSAHGTTRLSFKEQQNIYKGLVIDLNDEAFFCVDTAFSLAQCMIYAGLVDLKDKKKSKDLPSYDMMADDVQNILDLAHRDGSLKGQVKKDIKKYIVPDPEAVACLERFKKYGKKLLLITNSDFNYTKLLLEYAYNPYLKDHKSWQDLFDISITLASKPRFFTDSLKYLKIDTSSGNMTNHDGPLTPGIYQGGSADKLQLDLGLEGEEILYLGDHIYGDIVKLKKSCNWRTAMVVEELDDELSSLRKTRSVQAEIDLLMKEKELVEARLDDLYAKEYEFNESVEKKSVEENLKLVAQVDKRIAELIKSYDQAFNLYWGELLRSGSEESRLAAQIEKYACIYMTKVADFKDFSPRKYYRPPRRPLPHEIPE